MSLPKELLDQLLSGYLDDALTADERVRVEQLLQSNAEVADELQQLRDLRRSLQVLSRVDSKIRLEQGFADRVLGAAVARAREEGLGDDHPLVRLAEQPSTSTSVAKPSTTSWRIAAVMVGLAASIVIAVFLLRPNAGPGPGMPDPGMVAQSDIPAVETQSVPSETSNGETSTVETSANDAGPMLADNGQPAVQDVAVSDANVTIDRSAVGDAAPSPTGDSASIESIANSDAPSMTPEGTPTVTNPAGRTQLGAVLVVDVRRTESGRVTDAVAKALSAAEIAPASRKEVTEQIAGFVAGNLEHQPEEVSVLYLELPGKQFDLFYRQLWADEEGIESVRMTLAMNAPFLQVVDSVRPDPTAVRHEAAAYELFSQSGVVDQLVHEMSQLPFPEVNRRGAASGLIGSGPDIQAQVLVLVH